MDPWPAPLAASIRALGVPDAVPIVVGVSGGMDSVLLLDGLGRLAPERAWTLTVAHLDHGLREDSREDAAFVQELSHRAGVPCVVERLPGGWNRQRAGDSIEMAARRHRHRFLARVARTLEARFVVLGHHADDQAELLLMRLLRGAGSAGLGGMRSMAPSPADASVTLVRPLLGWTREQLRQHGEGVGLRWREDPTNRDPGILRNRVRHEILPYLEAAGAPGLARRLARTAELLADESDWIAAEAERWLRSARPRAFDRLPVALQRAVIRRQLWDLGHDGDWERVEALRRRSEVRMTVRGGAVLERSAAGALRPATPPISLWNRARADVDIAAPTGTGRFGPVTFRWRRVEGRGRAPRAASGSEVLDADAVGDAIRLRHWRAGDRFHPLGAPGPAKLQDLWINAKVPRTRRHDRVVATTADGTVFWVEGLPPGEAFRVRPDTRRRLQWRWRRDESGAISP